MSVAYLVGVFEVSDSCLCFRPAVSEELLGRLGSGDVTGAEKSDLSKDDVGSLLKLIEGKVEFYIMSRFEGGKVNFMRVQKFMMSIAVSL